MGLVLHSAGAVTTPNVLSDPRVRLTRENKALIEQARFRSVLAVPLLVNGTVIGAVSKLITGKAPTSGSLYHTEDILQFAQYVLVLTGVLWYYRAASLRAVHS